MLRFAIPAAVQLRAPLTSVAWERVYAAAMSRPFQGRLLREWASALEAGRLALIREAVRSGYVVGETTATIISKIRGTKALRYEDGLLARPRRDLAAVVQTALSHTAQTARAASYDANADLIKAVQWVSTLDNRTSPQCRVRDGLQYTSTVPHKPVGHSVPWGDGPGRLHFNCIPGDQMVLSPAAIRRAYRRPYKGDLIVIRTAAGRDFSCTPKHPVLTNDGWVLAELLEMGDKVIAYLGSDGESISDAKNDDVPTRIEDVFEAFLIARGVSAVEVPISAPDFHGDGAGSEVGIIATDCSLSIEQDAAFAQSSSDDVLVLGREAALAGLMRFCSLQQGIVGHSAPSGGVIRSSDQFSTLLETEPAHARELLLTGVASSDAEITKPALDDVGGHTLSLSNPSDADAFAKQFPRIDNIHAGDSSIYGRQTSISQEAVDDATADAALAAYLTDGKAGMVEADAVLEISRRSFSGHVYNLETDAGWFVAQGIITHNCRSVSVPVLKSWRELGIPIDDITPGTRASMDGQVPADMTYSQWLANQPAARQDEILGKERGALLRSGKVTVDKFSDAKGNWLSLPELLQRLHP
jgi:hypothetical protein